MDEDEKLRERCLENSSRLFPMGSDPTAIINTTEKFFQYIKNGKEKEEKKNG